MHLSTQHYAQAWYEALQASDPAEWEKISQAVLRRLQHEGKLNQLSVILDQIRDLESESSNKAFVTVSAAHPMKEADAESLVKKLLGVDAVELVFKQDESLLGGIVVQTKNHLWDLSVRHQLDVLKNNLKK